MIQLQGTEEFREESLTLERNERLRITGDFLSRKGAAQVEVILRAGEREGRGVEFKGIFQRGFAFMVLSPLDSGKGSLTPSVCVESQNT